MKTLLDPVPTFDVLGVNISALNLAQAQQLILTVRAEAPRGYICVADVHGVTRASEDPALRAVFNRAWLVTPDGMPFVWIGRRRGHQAMTRVYGPDLMLAVCAAGRAAGLTHYFYGGAPGVAEKLQQRLTERFPGLRVVGTCSPPFRAPTASETASWRAEMARLRPDVLWIGLGTPKQDWLMSELSGQIAAGVLIGVGAAFDFHSGTKPQAPRWMQRHGLEWFFRLCTEPRRLGGRYLRNNPLFIARYLMQAFGWRRQPPA